MTFVPSFTFDGETFDGESAYQRIDGEELVFLPKLDKQPMIRGILGYRARQASLELSYERTQHDGTFAGEVPMDATFQAFNVDGRYFFLPTRRVQPHVLFGGSLPFLDIENGSFLDPESAMPASGATASTPRSASRCIPRSSWASVPVTAIAGSGSTGRQASATTLATCGRGSAKPWAPS